MLNDEDLYPNPGDFDLGVTNSTATTAGMLPRVPSAPPVQLNLGANPATALGLTASPPPLSASPARVPGPNTTSAPIPQPQGVPRGTSDGVSSPPPDSPPPTLADILAGAQKANQTAFGSYSPENRQELLKYMTDKQNSTGNGVGLALSSLGDALVRGPGGRDSHFFDETLKSGKETTDRAMGNFDEMSKLKSQGLQTGMSLEQMDPSSPASKSMQTAARPMLMAAGLTEQQIAGLPANAIDEALKSATSFADAKAKLAQVAALRENTQGLKHDAQQNQLENQAMQRIQSVRGDQSLRDAESKRDASITVYNTIDNLKKEGRLPSKLEYFDLLGQMWKARTGVAPTDQAIKDLDTSTFKGDISKAASYFSGKPGGATTAGVLQNIQDFAKDSGLQADKFHENYMKPHLIKPTGLDDDRWAPIANTGRGQSFAEATKAAAQQGGGEAPVQKSVGGKNYVKQNGQWFQL